MDLRLQAILRQIESGRASFEAASDLPEDIGKFQKTARAILHAERMGYLEKVMSTMISSRGGLLYDKVFVIKGLTYEGEQALAEVRGEPTPVDDLLGELLERLPDQGIRNHWEKAVHRRLSDPRGSVTAARSFLETTMKWVLEQCGESTTDNNRILFLRTLKALKIAHDGKPLSRLLQGVDAIIGGVGDMRNKQGDAHGTDTNSLPLSGSEATLCVNLAGAAALYLLEEFERFDNTQAVNADG